MNTPTQNTELPQWHVDDGAISMEGQAHILLDDIGTDREWVSIGIKDDDGIAEVVALAHPINAPLIACAPTLLAENQRLREQVAQLTEALQFFLSAFREERALQLSRGESVAAELGQAAERTWNLLSALSAVERGQK